MSDNDRCTPESVIELPCWTCTTYWDAHKGGSCATNCKKFDLYLKIKKVEDPQRELHCDDCTFCVPFDSGEDPEYINQCRAKDVLLDDEEMREDDKSKTCEEFFMLREEFKD